MEEFDDLMNQKALILVFARSINCNMCDDDRWWVSKLNYDFMMKKDFYTLETNYGDIKEFDNEFGVTDDYENSQFFLFKDGNRKPYTYQKAETLANWITDITLIEHYPDFVVELDKETYFSYRKKNPVKNILVMFYSPNYKQTHEVVPNFYRNALAFNIEYSITFARVNCETIPGFCQDQDVEKVLGFKYLPAHDGVYTGEELDSVRGEKLTSFVNAQLGTKISGMGGYNEDFGRVKPLDVLAHQFMETTDAMKRKKIIKQVAKYRKHYKNTGKYYKIMKMMQKEGDDSLKREQKAIEEKLAQITDYESVDYMSLRSQENIIHQFEYIKTEKALVQLTPWSWSYIINGDNNVMVFIKTSQCRICTLLQVIYTNAANKGMDDVIFAQIDGDYYSDFVAYYITDPSIPAYWFQRGTSVTAGIPAKLETNVDSIFDFARGHMTPKSDSIKEEKEESEL